MQQKQSSCVETRLQAGLKARHIQALDVDLERRRPCAWWEVEARVRGRAHPVSHILCICHARREADDPNWLCEQLGNGAHARHNDFKCWAVGGRAKEMCLVGDEKGDLGDIAALAPAAAETVPVRRGRADNVRVRKALQVDLHRLIVRQRRGTWCSNCV